MNADQIVRFFTVVGEILEEIGTKEPYKILLIGGGYMITQVGNRDATKDIDCIFTSERQNRTHEEQQRKENRMKEMTREKHASEPVPCPVVGIGASAGGL